MDVRNRPSRAFVLGVLWILALVVTACDSTTEPAGEGRQLGVIVGFNNDDPRIVVPDTVQAGVEFVVEVTTYGNFFCDRKDETAVASSGNRVVITPYNYVETLFECPSLGALFVHQATVEFSEPGLASVVIQGRVAHHLDLDEDVVEFTREVVVLAQQASN